MNPAKISDTKQSPSEDTAAERLLADLEEAWQTGTAPDLKQFAFAQTAPSGPTRRQFLEHLIGIDLEFRWRNANTAGTAGDRPAPPRLEDYLEQLPELGSPEQFSLDCIAKEYRIRHWWGDHPNHAEYALRFPERTAAVQLRLEQVDAELSQSRPQPAATCVSPRRTESAAASESPLSLPIPDAATLLAILRDGQMLDPRQLERLEAVSAESALDAAGLGREMLLRNWLTPYQVGVLLQGRGKELVVGNYVLLEHLGDGGVGRVFKARHRQSQRVVALKVIRPELMTEPEVVARFRREIRVVGQLSHPHIVRALDPEPSDAIHMLAMEYIEGIDLGKRVRRSGPLSVLEACEYIRQAALALQYAHELGLVHRDLKPPNILVEPAPAVTGSPTAPFGCAKITDFGLARLHRPLSDDELTHMTRESNGFSLLTPQGVVMMGTPDYMAPEQAEDFHRADIRADIYSLGCTLYFLLTGQPPFPGGSLAEKLARHIRRPPLSVAAFRADLPFGVQHVLDRMLTKQPEQRFQTPGELAAALGDPELLNSTLLAFQADARVQEAADSSRESSGRPSPGSRRFWSRRRVLAAAASLVGLVVLWKRPRPKNEEAGSLPPPVPTVDESWLKMVRALPPDEQIEQVRQKLVALNPSFDGKLTYQKERDVVWSLSVQSDHVTNLAPVQALTGLRLLECGGAGPEQTGLADLTPLRGLKLNYFVCRYSQVTDLAPLVGMPLTHVIVPYSPLEDLSPLKGMNLMSVNIISTNVHDLSPIKKMPLSRVHCKDTKVVSLEPLRGNRRLTVLECAGTEISDLSPLQDTPLVELDCSRTRVVSLEPLKNTNLSVLRCSTTTIEDLTPLQNLRLTSLSCGESMVKDLTPLKNSKLVYLDCSRTHVSDLTPIAKMPLETLGCDFTNVRDLSPLKDQRTLKQIAFPLTPSCNVDALRGLPKLEFINNKRAANFWAEVDAQRK
jgi:serine/threonine-protein kinase